MTKGKLTLLALLTLLATAFIGCKDAEQDYRYVITNKTSIEDSLIVTYRLAGNSTNTEKRLAQGIAVRIRFRAACCLNEGQTHPLPVEAKESRGMAMDRTSQAKPIPPPRGNI